MDSKFLDILDKYHKEKAIPDKEYALLKGFYFSYKNAIHENHNKADKTFEKLLDIIIKEIANPFLFQPYHKKIITLMWGVLLAGIVATIFTEIWPIPIVINFQLYRMTVFLFIFGLIYSSNYLIKLFDAGLFSKIVSSGIIIALFYPTLKHSLFF